MKTKLKIILALTILSGMLYGQALKHPWSVLDGGGGKSSGGTLSLVTSVGQAGVQKMAYLDTVMVLESGYIPGVRFYGGTWTTTSISVALWWNLLSMPLQTPDMRRATLYPTATSVAFAYEPVQYVEADTLHVGRGYWLKFASPTTYPLNGSQVSLDTVPVYVGWNMIGSLTYPMLASSVTPIPPVAITSTFWGYLSGVGYYEEDTLKPGIGYWIKVDHAGSVVLNNTAPFLSQVQNIASNAHELGQISKGKFSKHPSEFAGLTIKDKSGQGRKLFYTVNSENIDLNKFELPPLPPTDILDVRFASQRYMEIPKTDVGEKQEFPIRINGGEFPMNIAWDGLKTEKTNAMLEIKYSNEKVKEYSLASRGNITIKEENFVSAKLIIYPSGIKELPKDFSLYQNYPNPFNPTTKIKYDLPKDSHVILKIFNLLGQEVSLLVDEMQQAGSKTIEWNTNTASNEKVSSGVYFYRLETSEFTSIKKMILLK